MWRAKNEKMLIMLTGAAGWRQLRAMPDDDAGGAGWPGTVALLPGAAAAQPRALRRVAGLWRRRPGGEILLVLLSVSLLCSFDLNDKALDHIVLALPRPL